MDILDTIKNLTINLGLKKKPEYVYNQEIKKNYIDYIYTNEIQEFLLKTIDNNNFEEIIKNSFHFENLDKIDKNHNLISTHLKANQLKNEIINNQENIKKNHDTIIKIIDDIEKIRLALQPLKELKIDFNIDLLGGALRDLVLNKDIKDIDLTIQLNGLILNDLYNCQNLQLIREFIKKNNLNNDKLNNLINYFTNNSEPSPSQEMVDSVQIDHFESSFINKSNFETEIVSALINQKHAIKGIYDYDVLHKNNNLEQSEYEPRSFTTDLKAIIKIEKQDFNYEIDLLNAPAAELYINDFDYEICKVYLKGENIVKNNVNLFWRNLSFDPGFLISVIKQKLYLDPNKITLDGLGFSLNERYQRLKAKYPQYQIDTMVLKGYQSEEIINQKKAIIEAFKQKCLIEETLPPQQSNKVKIKI